MRLRGGPAPIVLATLPLVAACRERAPERPTLARLLPALGDAVPLRLDSITRPATLLSFGEGRSCPIDAGPGARVRFWVGLPAIPPRGVVKVEARLGTETLALRRLAANRLGRWMELASDVPAGRHTLSITAQLVTQGDRPLTDAAAGFRVALGGPRLTHRSAGPRRVLVWISVDTVRADHLSFYGYARATSPALERLARQALVFENAMSTASWTLPSLVSQATSTLPSEHGAVERESGRRRDVESIFETLSRAGFTVLGCTGNPFVSASHGLAEGFDRLTYDGRKADHLRERLIQELDEWEGGDLALFIHFMDPHLTYSPPPPFMERFRLAPEVLAGLSAEKRALEDARSLYDGELAWTDLQIGLLLEALDARGLLDDAVIAYSADHGDELLDHGGWNHGHTLYQELVHVPLLVRVPGQVPRRIATPVSTIDLAPTLLEALGVKAPASFRGESLLRRLSGQARSERWLFAETQWRAERPLQYAVRDGDRKLVVALSRGPDRKVVREDLFDLRSDPLETRSLPDPPDALREAALRYAMHAADSHGPKAVVDPETSRQLRALGYVQ